MLWTSLYKSSGLRHDVRRRNHLAELDYILVRVCLVLTRHHSFPSTIVGVVQHLKHVYTLDTTLGSILRLVPP